MPVRNPRSLKPRNPGLYHNETYGRGGSSAPPDDMCINDAVAKTNIIRPRGKEGILWFRPMPQIDYADPAVLAPGRAGAAPQGQSDWYTRVNTANYIGMDGCPHYTFVLNYPWDKEGRWNGPYQTLYRIATERAKAAKYVSVRGGWQADWNILLPSLGGGNDRGAPISKPASKGFCQASAVYVNGKKDYTTGERSTPLGMAPDDDPIVIEISGSCGDNLIKLLDTPNKKYDGDGAERPWEAFFYGDATGIYNPATRTVKGGLIIGVFNPKEYNYQGEHTSWNGELKQGPQSYEVALNTAWTSPISKKKFSSSLDAQATARVFEKYLFWYDDGKPGDPDFAPGLIRVAPLEQQALWVAQAFAAAPRLLEFVWAEKPQFLTREVQGVLRQRRQAAMPGDPSEYAGEQPGASVREQAPPPRRPRLDPTQQAAAPVADDGDAQSFSEDLDFTMAVETAETAEPQTGFGDPDAGVESPPDEVSSEQPEGFGDQDAEAEFQEPVDADPFPGEAEPAPEAETATDQYFGVEEPAETDGEAVEAVFEEDQAVAGKTAQEGGHDPQQHLSDAEARVRQSMEVARSRAAKRVSTQVTAPVQARPAAPAAAPRSPQPPARPQPAAAARPQPTAARLPSQRPAPAAAAGKASASAAVSRTAAARPASKPAGGAPPASPARPAAAKPAAGSGKPTARAGAAAGRK